MATFLVGEIAICQNMNGMFSMYNDSECTVIGALEDRVGYTAAGQFGVMEGYKITLLDGLAVCVPPRLLRKRPLPEREIDRVVCWEECGWMPDEVLS